MRRLDRKTVAGLALVVGFVLLATIGPFLVGHPTAFVGRPLEAPSWDHWFGTTGQGQDVLAQTVVGARSTLAVGVLVGALVVLLGGVAGAAAAFLGGVADTLLSLIINVSLVMPGLPLMVIIAAWLPRFIAAARFRQPLSGAILHPLGILALLSIQWFACIRSLRGRPAEWKGRLYVTPRSA